VNGLLEVNGLEVAYGPSQVLFGVDLAMAEGEAATLLGRNGMGKTTTLRAICGLQAVKTGSIRFAGERIDGWRPDRIGRAGIALVPEGRQVFPNLTVARAFAGLFRQPARRPRAVDAGPCLRTLPATAAARKKPRQPALRRRTADAGDRPRAGHQPAPADPRRGDGRPRADGARGNLDLPHPPACAGQSILVVDKYVEKLIALADRHTIIQRGQVVWQGSSAALDADHGVWHRYLGIG
jgi:branched-chain amino acid transport system ATP-binding protein